MYVFLNLDIEWTFIYNTINTNSFSSGSYSLLYFRIEINTQRERKIILWKLKLFDELLFVRK